MRVGGVGLAENKATQPSLAGAWAELGKIEVIIDILQRRKYFQEKKIFFFLSKLKLL